MSIAMDAWVYVVVQNPGGDERIAGQHDETHGVAFIPAFMEKDPAQQGLLQMVREKGVRYEVQAILFEDLLRYAAGGPYCVFILDDAGRITERYSPAGQKF